MDRQPTLTGETLLLRPLVEADREALFGVARMLMDVQPSQRVPALLAAPAGG